MDQRNARPDLFGEAQVDLTFIGSQPPRTSWFAAWRRDRTIEDATEEIMLWRPSESGVVGCAPTPVRRVSLTEVLDATTASDLPGGSASTAFVLRAAETAIALVAHGAVKPAVTPLGADCWEAAGGPAGFGEHLAALGAACPAAVRANPVELTQARLRTAPALVTDVLNAFVDRLPRSPAAPIVSGHEAFAALTPTTIDGRRAVDAATRRIGSQLPLFVLRCRQRGDDLVAVLTLQDRDRPDEILDARDLWHAPPAHASALSAISNELSATLRRLSRLWPRLGELLEPPLTGELLISDRELDALLGPLGQRLGAAGLSVIGAPELLGRIELVPMLDLQPARGRRPRLDLSSLLDLSWQGTVDGRPLTPEEIEALTSTEQSVIRLRDRWVRLDAATIDQLRNKQRITAGEALALALDSEHQRTTVTGRLLGLADRLQNLADRPPIPIPAGLEAELRPYQAEGLSWMAELASIGLGGLLADDMGLGKTVQLIALQRHLVEQSLDPESLHALDVGPTLVVCPASVIGNWEREWRRFSPRTSIHRYHGTDRELDAVGPGTVTLATYGVALRDAAELAAVDWHLVVADEAQAIKNPASRTSRALRSIPAKARFALTGTPIQNELLDLWALLDWAAPGLLGPQDRFRTEIIVPIEEDEDPEATDRLNRLVQPFVLRRRKTDPGVAPDLPPKTETDEIVPLTAEQARLYRAVVDEAMTEIAGTTGFGRQGLVLRLLTRLKQVCNHPVQLLGAEDDTEGLAGRSGKLDRTVEIVEHLRTNGEQALVFSQYVQMGDLLVRHLQSQGHTVGFFHGGLTVNARDDLVARFERGDVELLVVSLRAGGIGLNLTAATQVIHYDRWWNPAVEDQASARAWRLGQDQPVQVHRLISEGTIEDHIATLLTSKRRLADAVIGTGEGWISSLDDDALTELVSLGSGDGVVDPFGTGGHREERP